MKKQLNLKAETLCGYKVSAKMKKVWQTQINILIEIDKVCKKHNIKYIMADGSLLGCIRHKGFIPWDDDIDIMMTRSEYEKFCKVAEKEFKKPLFFRTSYNDNVFRGIGQVVNCDTTAIMYNEFCRTANNGIFVDVFIVDKIPENKFKRKIHQLRCNFAKRLLCFQRVYICHETHNIKQKIIRLLLNIFFGIVKYDKFFRHYEKLCAKYNKTDSKKCGIIEYIYDDRVIRVNHLLDLKMYDFEYLKVPGPKDGEEFLTDFFGDWKKFVIGSGDHGSVFFDPDKSYTEYLKMSIDEIKKIEDKES